MVLTIQRWPAFQRDCNEIGSSQHYQDVYCDRNEERDRWTTGVQAVFPEDGNVLKKVESGSAKIDKESPALTKEEPVHTYEKEDGNRHGRELCLPRMLRQ